MARDWQTGGLEAFTKWFFDSSVLKNQFVAHHAPQVNLVHLGGVGCLAGDEPIYDPILGTHTSVRELAEAEQPITVLSWNGQAFVQAGALPPFKKGNNFLYQVTLANGAKVKATNEHKFLTPQGFLPLRLLSCGSLIGVQPNLDQTTHKQDEKHYLGTVEDFAPRCSPCWHQCGEQPLQDLVCDLGAAPLQVGVHRYIHLTSCVDAHLVQAPEYNHQNRVFYHHANNDSSFLASHPVVYDLSSRVSCAYALARRWVPQPHLQSWNNSIQASQACEFHLPCCQAARLSCDNTPLQAFCQLDVSPSPYARKEGRWAIYQGVQTQLPSSCACDAARQDAWRLSMTNLTYRMCSRLYQAACDVRSAFYNQYQGVCTQHSMCQDHHKDALEDPWSNNPSDDASCNPSYNNNIGLHYSGDIGYSQIVGIEYCGIGDFYDLHVPIYNNYVASGMVHHNSGKTLGVAYSLFTHAFLNPYLRALNTSITSGQSELAFNMLSARIEDNKRVEPYIADIRQRPYPTITFVNGAEITFRTAGYEARNIRGFEYDIINFDEGGYEPRPTTLQFLRGRLRGRRPDGVPRFNRLSITTTPTDMPWLIRMWELGSKEDGVDYDPEHYCSIRSTTYDNTYLTPGQIAEIVRDYSDSMVQQEIHALFPDYGDTEFSRSSIEACESQELNDLMEANTKNEQMVDGWEPKPGWGWIEHPRHGIVYWQVPPIPGHVYVLSGDPGASSPPKRNAGCVMVFDATKEPYTMVYFHWTDGKGSLRPFLQSYKFAGSLYNPLFSGLDATGPQKGMAEIAFEDYEVAPDNINFQRDKDSMTNGLKQLLTGKKLRFPFIKGLHMQLRAYKRDDKQLAQDLVATIMQQSNLTRALPTRSGGVGNVGKMKRVNTRGYGRTSKGRGRDSSTTTRFVG